MSYSVHVHTPDPQSSDPATAGTARTGNRAAYGRILALALPTFGQLIAEPTFVLIDTAIVGHIGVSALAGLSIGSTIILTAVGLCIFLAYSTTAQVAHLLGAGRRREGLQAGIDGLWLALGIGIVLAFSFILFSKFGEEFAKGGLLPPGIAVWIPNIIYSFIAFYLYKKAPK